MDALAEIIGGILGGLLGLGVVYFAFIGFRKVFSDKIPLKNNLGDLKDKNVILSSAGSSSGALPQEKQSYRFDLSKAAKKVEIILHALPRGQQFIVTEYGVVIDGKDFMKISKNSDAIFILDDEAHLFQVFALANTLKKVYGEVFGKPSGLQITFNAQKNVEFDYIGPFWMWSEGKLREKQNKK